MPFVPVVDISADPDAVGAEVDEICRTVGFFQITGHGIADDVAEPAWHAATAFFDLPPDDKLSVARPAPDYPYGYIPLAGESLSQSMTGLGHCTPPDLKEVFNAGPPSPPVHPFADPDEAWAGVEPVPGAFVINIGDLMARWTNDRWRSTLHRVADPPGHPANVRRQSMPYFQNANWSARVSCLPTCLGPGEAPRYQPVLAGPRLMRKFRRSVTFRESA
jgi:isopenicillin N synthase-like dioxygenase